MKILVTSLPDLRNIPPQRPHYLLHHLSARHAITVRYLSARDSPPVPDPYLDTLLERMDVRPFDHADRHPVLQECAHLRPMGGSTATDGEDCDLHITLNCLLAGYLIARRFAERGTATVADYCDDVPELIRRSPSIPAPLRPAAALAARRLVGKNIQVATRVSCVTRSLRDAYGMPGERTTVIPNGVDCGFFRRRPGEPAREKLGIPAGAFVVGFIGILSPWVDLHPVFRAVRALGPRIPDLRVLIVGRGPGLGEVRKQARDCHVEDRVILTGHTPYREGPGLIAAMDVGILPRRPTPDSQNSFPLKVLEYMACEKPVISTPLAGIRDAMGDIPLYALDAGEFRDQITRLYRDELLRETKGKEGRAFVSGSCSWDDIAARFAGLVQEAHAAGRQAG